MQLFKTLLLVCALLALALTHPDREDRGERLLIAPLIALTTNVDELTIFFRSAVYN